MLKGVATIAKKLRRVCAAAVREPHIPLAVLLVREGLGICDLQRLADTVLANPVKAVARPKRRPRAKA